MITEDLMKSYSITSAGNALSSLICSFIVNEFSTELPTSASITAGDPVAICFDKYGRGDGYKINKCIEDGITVYIQNYAEIHLQTSGTSESTGVTVPPVVPPPLEVYPPLTIDSAYNLTHDGSIIVNNSVNVYEKLFTTFSLNRLMGIDPYKPKTENDISAVVDDLFDDIISWLDCNMGYTYDGTGSPSLIPEANSIYIKSYGYERETWIEGTSTLSLIATEDDIKNIKNYITTNITKLNSDNYKVFSETNKPMDGYFECVWGIISTGLVDYLNFNEVYSGDTGGSIFCSMVYKYSGTSKGKAIFQEKQILMSEVEALSYDIINVKLTMGMKIDDASIDIDTTDSNGNPKRFTFKLFIDRFTCTLTNITTAISDFFAKFFEAVTQFYQSIIDVFIRIGETFEVISEYLSKAYEFVLKIFEKIYGAISTVIGKAIKQIKKFLNNVFIRNGRKLEWDALNNGSWGVLFKPFYLAKQAFVNATHAYKYGYGKIEYQISNNKIIGSISRKIVKITNKCNEITLTKEKLGDKFCYDAPLPPIPPEPSVIPVDSPPQVPDVIDPPKPVNPITEEEFDTPKVPSEDVEFDGDGNLIGESPVATTATDAIVAPIIAPIDESAEQAVSMTKPEPPTQPTESELATKYPPEVPKSVAPIDRKYYKPVSSFTTSDAMKKQIKSHEKLSLVIYRDANKKFADIGYGHVLGNWVDRSKFPQSITKAQADAYFDKDIKVFENAVKRYVRQLITQGQFDSFVDLAYNAGPGKLLKSDSLKAFNRGNVCKAGQYYKVTCITYTADGVVRQSASLRQRRLDTYRFFWIVNIGTSC